MTLEILKVKHNFHFCLLETRQTFFVYLLLLCKLNKTLISISMFSYLLTLLGEWPDGLMRYDRIRSFLVQTSLGAWLGLGTRPQNKAPGHSVHWGINPPLKKTPHLSCQAPHLNLQNVQASVLK